MLGLMTQSFGKKKKREGKGKANQIGMKRIKEREG